MKWWSLPLALTCLACLSACENSSKPAEVKDSLPETKIARRELLFILDRQKREGKVDPKLEAALEKGPPSIWWKKSGDSYSPIIPEKHTVTGEIEVDLAIVGGELEAVTTAMAAAKKGLKVALITDTDLGGISSDTAGNMRFVDSMPGTERTPAQLELYKAIGLKDFVGVPDQTGSKIESYIDDVYENRIETIRVAKISNLLVEKSTQIESLTTDTGVKITAAKYLDMDPESRLAELSGLDLDINTPALSYGLVFDLKNIEEKDYKSLENKLFLTPESILKYLGVSWEEVKDNKAVKTSYEKLLQCLKKEKNFITPTYSLGYISVAEGFNFMMQVRGATKPTEDLKWLNEKRMSSGFNIAHFADSATLNSMSYMIPATILQHEHSLSKDSEWSPIVNTEVPALEEYFQYVTGNVALKVRISDEFYVRRSTAHVKTLHPFTEADFVKGPTKGWWMTYMLDFRDLRPRDEYDKELFRQIVRTTHGRRWWVCRPSTTETEIPNLYVLNKCAVTPQYSGGLRIIQNLINTGQAWVESLPKK